MSSPTPERGRAWEEISRLNQLGLDPREFWQRFVALALRATGCDATAILFRGGSGPWRVIASALRAGPGSAMSAAQALLRRAAELADQHLGEPVVITTIPTQREGESCRLLLVATNKMDPALHEQACALTSLPVAYDATHALNKVEADIARLTRVLDSLLLTNSAPKFGASALALCNALATHFECDRVSLGWHTGGYCKLQAISRTENFDRKMELIQKIEAAMDECLDQDEEILFPAPSGGSAVARDHEKLAAAVEGASLLSLPLRSEDKLVGALTCERETGFTETDVATMRLSLDAALPRLRLLQQRDRWWGARLWQKLREGTAGLLGPRHTMTKLTALLITAALAVLLFWKVDYRVEGTYLLRSDRAATLSAPFEGFIKEVLVEAGDHVAPGQVLLKMDTEPLRVEESAAVAELDRYRSEADKARASKSPAEMRISEALARQAQAKLDVVRFQLSQAEVKSPLQGVIVEGDLKERLNAPLKQGDALFRIAEMGKMYLEFQLDERDAHEVAAGSTGEAAFVSQPDERIPIKVEVMVPAAMEKEGTHAFTGRARFQFGERDWWRPGMSGICKLEAGRRTLFWILTHRTVDFLRLKLWW